MANELTPEVKQLILDFQYVNLVSLILSIVLFVFLLLTRFKGYKATQRLSYKLYTWIALADILTHFPMMINYKGNLPLCRAVTISGYWVNFFTLFLTAVLAYNLHMVFIRGRPDLVKSEFIYVGFCLIASIVVFIPTLTMALIKSNQCLPYKVEDERLEIGLFWLFFGLWVIALTLYCFVVIIWVIYRLRSHSDMSSSGSTFTDRHLRKIVTRLILYPTVPVLTMFPYIVTYSLQTVADRDAYPSIFVNLFASEVQGILNFIFFLFDPALPDILTEMRGKLRKFSWESSHEGSSIEPYRNDTSRLQKDQDVEHIPLESGAGISMNTYMKMNPSLSSNRLRVMLV